MKTVSVLRYMLGCTVMQVVTASGIWGYVVIPGTWEGSDEFAAAYSCYKRCYPDRIRVKAVQL